MSSRLDKIAIAISFISLIVSIAGFYVGYLGYSIANNYPPYIDVSSTSLVFYPTLCDISSYNVSCIFTGKFNVSFTIIAPHVGTYNITSPVLSDWSFYPSPTKSSTNENGISLTIGNVTFDDYPPLTYMFNGGFALPHGGVPVSSSQPFDKTEEMSITGFKLVAPSSSVRNIGSYPEFMGFSGGQAQLSFLFTFTDLQLGREFTRVIHVQAFFST